MKEFLRGSHVVREYPPIYHYQFLGDQNLYLEIDGREVHLPSLIEAIPHDVLVRAAESIGWSLRAVKQGEMTTQPLPV